MAVAGGGPTARSGTNVGLGPQHVVPEPLQRGSGWRSHVPARRRPGGSAGGRKPGPPFRLAEVRHQARRQRRRVRSRQDRAGDPEGRRGDRRVRRGHRARPRVARRARHRPQVDRPRAGDRGDPGPGRADARGRRALRDRPRLHRLPRAAQAPARGEEDAGRRRAVHRRVPRAEGLARQRQREPGLLARRADPQRLGQGGRQLLARPRLRARGGPRAPRRRPAHPRPRHAGRLLRRLVAADAALRGPQRRARQGRGRARRSTCRARWGRSSTSSARCRTSGRARRRSARSTPTWRRSSAPTACRTGR